MAGNMATRSGKARPDFDVKAVLPYRVVIYPPVEWGGLFQRPHHMALQLGKRFRRVHFVQPAGLRNPSLADVKRLKGYILTSEKLRDRPAGGAAGPEINRLPFVPFHGISFFEAWNARVFQGYLKKMEVSAKRTLLWIASPAPFIRRALERMKAVSWVFDWMDDYSIFPQLPVEVIRTQYWMVREADAVFTSSVHLRERAENSRDNGIYYLPNGVDMEHWAGHFPSPFHGERPFGRNVIGYFGTISHWLDGRLIATLASKRKDWNFVFIGPRADNGLLDSMFALPNCHHVPPQPYEKLPGLAAHFDSCWIPFKRKAVVKSINPVKAYEYLALGKPVVSVPLPDLEALSGVVAFATGPASFEQALSKALSDPGGSRMEAMRMTAVEPYSWEALGFRAADILADLY